MRPDETMESPLFAAPGAVTTTVASAEPDATRGAEDRTAAVAMLERGEVVGRYVVLDRIGAGAMGVVYAAFDPELDRKVALKLLQPASGAPATPASAADTTASARLLREAQALARLAHPNVVAVHDVGTRGDQVWIAMEFVAGQTLGRWMRAQRRGWREVVELLRSAGRGLAAAHAAGLIHRDFKPESRRPSQTAPQPTDRPHSHSQGRFERVDVYPAAPGCSGVAQVLAKRWQRPGPPEDGRGPAHRAPQPCMKST